MSSGDELFKRATELVGAELNALSCSGTEIGEKAHLEPAFRRMLKELQPDPVDDGSPGLPLPNWTAKKLGGPDVLVRWPDGRPRYAAELKVRKTDETLWDLYKMIDALNVDGMDTAYLVVAASKKQWKKEGDACTEPFRDEGLSNYPSPRLFENNKKAWWNLLWGGTARPIRIPGSVTTRLIEKSELCIDGAPGWLKCIAVEAGDGDPIPFPPDWHDCNWPAGVVPGPEYFDNPPPNGCGARGA